MLVGAYSGLLARFAVRCRDYLQQRNERYTFINANGVVTKEPIPIPIELIVAGVALVVWFLVWVWICFKAWRKIQTNVAGPESHTGNN